MKYYGKERAEEDAIMNGGAAGPAGSGENQLDVDIGVRFVRHHARTYTHTYTYIYTHLHTHKRAHAQARTHTSAHTHKRAHTHTHRDRARTNWM